MAHQAPPERHEPFIYELAWILPSIAIPTTMLVAMVLTAFAMGIRVPTDAGTVRPDQLAQTPPFDQPGLVQLGPGRYQLTLIARTWSFQPNEVRVPVDAEVEIVGTSGDVIHGFELQGTNANLMLVPGRISRTTVRLSRPGTYQFVCHEYCGIGHHLMFGRVIVEGSP